MSARTFSGQNMMAALAQVQQAFGPEALIVSVRQVPGGPAWQVWRQPRVEVVAMPQAALPAAHEAPPLAKAAPEKGSAPRATPPSDMAALKAQLADMAARLDRVALPAWPPLLAAAFRQLIAQGVDDEIARAATSACAENLTPRALDDELRVHAYLQQTLERGLKAQSDDTWIGENGRRATRAFQKNGGLARVLCVIGTGGAGKTASAAKLAAYHKRTLGLRVAWVCADTVRAGAIAQARAYAETLKLPLRVAYTADELAQAVAAEADADLILVDTAGVNPRRDDQVVELGGYLTALPQRSTYLVAPATAKDGDLREALAACGPFNLTALILTKLDETGTFGSVFNLAWRSRLPLAYFAAGPNVLDDLQPAQTDRLVSALFSADNRWTSGGGR